MVGYALLVWTASGLLAHHWWPQMACLMLSAYVMAEMNTAFSLLRVRSNMVASVFIALSCMPTFLFGSLWGALVQLFFLAGLLFLLSAYQSPQSLGRIFYAFVLIGLAGVLSAHVLLLLPLLWLLMATQVQALSWRGWVASLIGLATPWWFLCVWFIFQRDFSPLVVHFASLSEFAPLPSAYTSLSPGHWLSFVLTAVLTLTGIVHFWRNSIDEKIRTRLLFGLFTWMSAASLLLTALQPQLFDPMMRLAVVCASPLVAHFMTLTSTRITNIVFFVIIGAVVTVTAATLLLG